MKRFHGSVPRRTHRKLAHLLLALTASALVIASQLAQAANTPAETYRCLETAKSAFSVGVALSSGTAAAGSSMGAVTLIRAANEDSEENFTISSLRRENDRIELDLNPIGQAAEATGLKTLLIRPSGRAESAATIRNAAVTLSCTRQFIQ